MKRALRVILVIFASAIMQPACASDEQPDAAATAGPRYVIYYNSDASPLKDAIDTLYTHIILSFITARVDEQDRLQLILPKRIEPYWKDVPRLKAQGKKVMVSFGGGDFRTADYAPLAGREQELAGLLADFVRSKKLDGIDIDFEASETFHTKRGEGIIDGRSFIINLSKALRRELPAPDYLLSHAPQPPYLSQSWHAGPYLDILNAVGDSIDWISVQYYGNPEFEHPVQEKVVGEKHATFHTSYRGLTSSSGLLKWPSHKVVVGKPIYKDDARSGHLEPVQVRTEILDPLLRAYGNKFGGLMGWQFSTLTEDHRAWNNSLGRPLLDDNHQASLE
jgi:chitinase